VFQHLVLKKREGCKKNGRVAHTRDFPSVVAGFHSSATLESTLECGCDRDCRPNAARSGSHTQSCTQSATLLPLAHTFHSLPPAYRIATQ
jgi:hypothetical protein